MSSKTRTKPTRPPSAVDEPKAADTPSSITASQTAESELTGQIVSSPIWHPQPSKIGQALALLGRAEGTTLVELVEATGWQARTVRAALTGLRKKGHTIARAKREGMSHYTLEACA